MTTSKTDKIPAYNQTKLKTEPEPALPWGPVSAVIVTVGSYFASQVGGYLVIMLVLSLMGWSSLQISSWFDDSNFAKFLAVLVIEGLALLLLYLFLRGRKAKPKQLGLVAPKWRDIPYTLLGFGAYFVVNVVSIVLVNALIPSIDTAQKQELGFSETAQGLDLVFIFFSLVVLPPIVEEIFTRGFLYTGLASRLPKIIAALATSALFALVHLQFGSGNQLLWIAAVDTFILSMVLIYLRDKTGSLWSPIGVHFTKNLLAFLAIFVFRVV